MVFVAFLSGQLMAQSSNSAENTETLEEMMQKQSDEFYGKLNATLLEKNYLFPKRAHCMKEKLKEDNIFEKLRGSDLDKNDFDSIFNRNDQLAQMMNDATFSCTIVGYCAIVVIVLVMLTVVSCVSCLSKKK